MKVFTTPQIRQLDQYTIEHEPILSINLMERAADALFDKLITLFPAKEVGFCVFAGPGNNGGDALALARKLKENERTVQVHLISNAPLSKDCEINKTRLLKSYPDIIKEHGDEFVPFEIAANTVLIDGLFGSGLSRPLSGVFAEVVDFINESENTVVAIDIPSGLHGDTYHRMAEPTVKADYTFCFQFPKIAFFISENDRFVGSWSVLDIQIHQQAIAEMKTDFYFLEIDDLRLLHKKREKFAHKGSFGHLVLLAGSKGMAGASILSAKAALRSGVGLLTVHGPEGNRCILQTISPEVIYEADQDQDCITRFFHAEKYDAIAIGPGIGTQTVTVEMLQRLLQTLKMPCVLDADALNIIAAKKQLLKLVPPGSILTPHPKEFERLFGVYENSFYMVLRAMKMAARHQIYIVLKGANTKIITPEGKVFINSSGNPGMATAGSGDVLTGILGSLLAQGYSPENAAKLGVYLHGLSADLALDTESEESMTAGDIVAGLGKAFKYLRGN